VSRAEKHPSDEGKYQSTFDSYGHGVGKGKSRAAVYKHYKKINGDFVKPAHSKEGKSGDFVKESKPKKEKSDDFVKDDSDDFVKDDSDDFTKTSSFSDISWLSDEDLDGIDPTIPKPIRALAAGDVAGMSAAQRATQTQLINWGFIGIDRGLTHWGRGVTGHEEWTIQRHPMDYEAMTGATQHLMDENGVSINLNPTLVWATVMSAAYVPPVSYVARNSDKTKRRLFFKRIGGFFRNPFKALRRRRIADVEDNRRVPIQAE